MSRFERFSSWRSLIRAIASIIHIVQAYKANDHHNTCRSWHHCSKPRSVEELLQAETAIIRVYREKPTKKSLKCIVERNDIPRNSPLRKLSPYLDNGGLLRIGGRLKNATLDLNEKFPLIIPGRSHVAKITCGGITMIESNIRVVC